MKYLVYQDWPNTSGNHAGIKYLCDYLAREYPLEYQSIPMPPVLIYRKRFPSILGKIEMKWKYYYYPRRRNLKIFFIIRHILKKYQTGDKVFLMEYMIRQIGQNIIAEKLKENNIPIYVMAHLTPPITEMEFDLESFNKWLKPVDILLTLGNSLTTYYIKKGFNKKKIHTTFHYVDDYYLNNDLIIHKTFTIIVMGNMFRDTELLQKVVENNPDVHFKICQGMQKYPNLDLNNVTLLPFMQEEELRQEMNNADVSLNIMKDTVGSNVIVTSLGMGLAMICSDVGSIRDYCDETNTIFCKSLEDYNDGIRILKNSSSILYNMRTSARRKAEQFRIKNFYKDFSSI